MELKLLVEKIKIELSDKIFISKDSTLGLISQIESYPSLVSFLRDRIFHNDKKVDEFLDAIKAKYDTKISIQKKSELSEAEFTEFMQKALEKAFKEKSSKFKFVSHYFSTEKDLVIKIADINGFESVYRVMTIKTT
jgi:hypothetical protein